MQVKVVHIVSLATLTAFLTLVFLYTLQMNGASQKMESYERQSSHLYTIGQPDHELYITQANERRDETVTTFQPNSLTAESNVQKEEANIITNLHQNMKANQTIHGNNSLKGTLNLPSSPSKDSHSLRAAELHVSVQVQDSTSPHQNTIANPTNSGNDSLREAMNVSPSKDSHSLSAAELHVSVQEQQANSSTNNTIANLTNSGNSSLKEAMNVSPSKDSHSLIRDNTHISNHTPTPRHLPNCRLQQWQTHPSIVNETEHELELQIAYRNLDKCLEGAELSNYFENRDYLSTARKNVNTLLSTIRRVVPTHFRSHYGTSCWDSKLSVQYCEEYVPLLMRRVEGSVGRFVFKTMLDLFEYELRTELKTKVNVTSSTLCLPTLFIAGFPKCGSTHIYCLVTNLVKLAYPTYTLSSFALGKEPHWWVPRGPHSNSRYPHQPTRFVGYLMNYIRTAKLQKNSSFALPIDGSPNLIFQWQRYSPKESLENYCLVPAVLPQILLNGKYIVVMRNPADMLYSAFWFSCSASNIELSRTQQLRGPDIFHEKVEKKIMMFQNCTNTRPVDACLVDVYPPITSSFGGCGRVRLEVGFYYYYIRRWLSVVPVKQFFFLTIEELRENVTYVHVANKVSEFLGLGVHIKSVETLRRVEKEQQKTRCDNIQSQFDYHRDTQLQMRSDTRKLLNDFFKPYNQKLAELLGDKKYLWLPPG